MGEWLDFGPYNDDDEEEFEEDGDTVDFEAGDASGPELVVCASCQTEYRRGQDPAHLHRTVVDVTQKYPALDFARYALARLTVRSGRKVVAVEDTCRDCWNRDTWSRIQRSHGYPSRS